MGETGRWHAALRLVSGVVVAIACLSWAFRFGGHGTGAVLLATVLFLLGMSAAAYAVRSAVRLALPGVLEIREHQRWLAATAHLHVPGGLEVALDSVGPRPINVIKAVREVTGCGLVPARQAVEAVGVPVVSGLSRDSCRHVVELLERAGATAVIRPGAG